MKRVSHVLFGLLDVLVFWTGMALMQFILLTWKP